MEAAKPYLDYFAAHPEWALVIVFLIAFGEALLIIGLFVPSTVALVGAGMLVGMGKLDFWPVFWATAIGAIVGDQLSYWAGRFFGEQLKTMWPLREYSGLVAKGEDFVRQHGGKSIAVGRFIPGIKAVVPGIVGMLRMNQPYFVFVNVTSGLFWTAMHVLPGVLLGQGLAVAGDLSGRLLIVLLVLLGILGVAGWLIRLAAASLAPRFRNGMVSVSSWARSRASSSRSMHRLGRIASPDNPRSFNLLVYGLALFAALLGFAYLVLGLLVRETVSNLDRSLATLLGELRNAHSDDLMVPLMMMGNTRVISFIVAVIVIWLALQKSWRAAGLTIGAWCAMLVGLFILRWALDRPGPLDASQSSIALQSGFPNIDITLAATALGFLIVFAGHAMGRWSRAVVATICGLWVLLLCFSRLYLGVAWLSDLIAGLLLAAIVVAIFGIVIEAMPSRRIRPMGLLAGAGLVYMAVAFAHVSVNGERQLASFETLSTAVPVTEAMWLQDPLKQIPSQRVDLAGKPEDTFVAQWRGDTQNLTQFLTSSGWSLKDKWSWRDGFQYLNTKATIGELPPKPLLNEGLKAKVTAVRDLPNNERLVLRAFKSRVVIGEKPLYLISLTRETVKTSLSLYALPKTHFAEPEDVKEVQALLKTQPGMRFLASRQIGSQTLDVFSQ